MSVDDPNSSTSKIRLKHLSTALTIAVLMQRPIRRMTVRQLYPQGTQTLSPFECACNDGVLPLTLTLRAEAYTHILVLCIMRTCIGCGVLEKDEGVVGRTRDPRRVYGAVSGATVYLYGMQAFALAIVVYYTVSRSCTMAVLEADLRFRCWVCSLT